MKYRSCPTRFLCLPDIADRRWDEDRQIKTGYLGFNGSFESVTYCLTLVKLKDLVRRNRYIKE